MVRLLLMSKPIEHQFLKKVGQLDLTQRNIIVDVLRLPKYDSVTVALCNDGSSQVTDKTLSEGLQQLYRLVGINVGQVIIRHFSFMANNIEEQHALLEDADIFWFGGVWRSTVPDRLKNVLNTNENNLAAHLREKIQYNHMPLLLRSTPK